MTERSGGSPVQLGSPVAMRDEEPVAPGGFRRGRRRLLTRFVLPRTGTDIGPGAHRILYVGDPMQAQRVGEMLKDCAEPSYRVDVVGDQSAAIAALKAEDHAAVVVEVRHNRSLWDRFLRERSGITIPIICVDFRAGTRGSRRAEIMQEGAAAWVAATDLSPPLIEHALFSSIDRARLTQALGEVQERFALALRGSKDGVWEWVLASGEMHFSRRWRELLGYQVDELSDSVEEWMRRVHPEDIEALKAEIAAHLAGDKPYLENEHRILARDGTYRWVISRAVAQREGGVAVRMAGSITDTSDFKRREEKLRAQSRQDPLTGLHRREAFLELLHQATEEAKADPALGFCVLMVDVDRFRWLADSIGHQAADRVLALLAHRVVSAVRPGDTVCRFSGDKFAVVLRRLCDLDEAAAIAQKIRTSVHEPFNVDGQTLYMTVSIGLTSSDRGRGSADELISDVAAAANKAKERGQDRHEFFNTSMRTEAISSLRKEVALRQAVERHEFVLHYQPIVDIRSGRLLGFEALSRWCHPHQGLIGPSEFIPTAEQTGLILPIGRWALGEAVRQLSHWQRSLGWSTPLTMSVNISGRQLADQGLLGEIGALLAAHPVAPGSLRLELTESVLMDNPDRVCRLFEALREAGPRLWVDDFGTGYSSLSYLHRFPVDGLKIDKSFVDALRESSHGPSMIRTIVELAANLRVELIAEGIEGVGQAQKLLELGCQRGQGFLYGRPVQADHAALAISRTVAR